MSGLGLFERLLLDVAGLAHAARVHYPVTVGTVRGHLFASHLQVALLTEAPAVVLQVRVLAHRDFLGGAGLPLLRGRLIALLRGSKAFVVAMRLFLILGLELILVDDAII